MTSSSRNVAHSDKIAGTQSLVIQINCENSTSANKRQQSFKRPTFHTIHCFIIHSDIRKFRQENA